MGKSKKQRVHTSTDQDTKDTKEPAHGDSARTFVSVTSMPRKQRKAEPAVPSGMTSHLAVLEPIPDDAKSRPIDWAGEHLESLVPQAAKEKEWQLKFGSDERRDRVASEILAMKGIAAKRDAAPVVQPAIVLIQSGPNPFAQRALPATVDAAVRGSVGVREGRGLTHSSGEVTVEDDTEGAP